MPRRLLRATLLAGLLPVCAAAQTAVPVIDVTPSGPGVTVTGIVAGLGPGVVDAEMTISRKDQSGAMETRQSRTLEVGPDSRDIVATTGLSTAPGLRMTVTLTLREEGRVTATSQTVIGPQD